MSQSDDSPQCPDWCQQVHLPGQPHRGEWTVTDADSGRRVAIVSLIGDGDEHARIQFIQTGVPWRLTLPDAEDFFYVLTVPTPRVAPGAQALAGAQLPPGA
jgi:hypothetical protein